MNPLNARLQSGSIGHTHMGILALQTCSRLSFLPSQPQRSTPVWSMFFYLELYSWKLSVFSFTLKPFIFIWPFVLGWLQRNYPPLFPPTLDLIHCTIGHFHSKFGSAWGSIHNQQTKWPPVKILWTALSSIISDSFVKFSLWRWSQKYGLWADFFCVEWIWKIETYHRDGDFTVIRIWEEHTLGLSTSKWPTLI